MANILLKDKNGANVIYNDISFLNLKTAEGGTVRFNEHSPEIISVVELPVEEINNSAVYRVTSKDENGVISVKFYVHTEEGEWVEIAIGAKLVDQVITENGEYAPEDIYDGFAKVVVDVAGSNGGAIEVEQFPTEKTEIDNELIYKIAAKETVDNLYFRNDEGVETMALLDPSIYTLNYILVDTKPEDDEILPSDLDNLAESDTVEVYLYIAKDSGMIYVKNEADFEVSAVFEEPVRFAYSVEEVKQDGYWYVVINQSDIYYGVPNLLNDKSIYENCGEGWAKINKQFKTVRVLPQEKIQSDVIYKIDYDTVEGLYFRYGDAEEEINKMVPFNENCIIDYVLVETLPSLEEMLPSDPENLAELEEYTLYYYVEKETGLIYLRDINTDSLIQIEEEPVNFAESLSDVKNDGTWYALIQHVGPNFGFANEDGQKKFYAYTKEGEWVELKPCTHVSNMVPNDGSYVHSVYVNTQLSAKEIIDLYDAIPKGYWLTSGLTSMQVVYDTSVSYAYIFKEGADDGSCKYSIRIDGEEVFACSQDSLGNIQTITSWTEDKNVVLIQDVLNENVTGMVDDEGNNLKAGRANHMLVNLLSIKPFAMN